MLKKITTILLALLCLGMLSQPVLANESEIAKALEALVDMDPSARSQGARTLSYYAAAAEERAVPKLLESLQNDPDMGVKRNVVLSLGEMAKVSDQPENIIKPLVNLLSSENKSLALAAALVLENFPKDPSVSPTEEQRIALYRETLNSKETLGEAAECLAASTNPESLTILSKALEQETTQVMAVRALLEQKQAAAVPLVISFAREALLSEKEDTFDLGLYAASRLADASPLEKVLTTVSTNDKVSGVEAALLLYKLSPGPDKLAPFQKALQSSDPAIQQTALVAVYELQDGDKLLLTQNVLAILDKAEDPDVVQTVFRLGRAKTPGNPDYLPEMLKKASHESPMVRLSLAQSIPEFGAASKQGVEVLKTLLKDEEAEIQIQAILGLFKMTGDFSMIEKTLNALAKDDDNFEQFLNSYYTSSESDLSRGIGELLWEKSKAGKTRFYPHLAARNSVPTKEELAFFNQNFEELNDSTRNAVLSRLYYLHPAQPGVIELLQKGLKGEGDSVWTAATLYLSFTGDGDLVKPLITGGLKSGDSNKVSQALSTLSQAPTLVEGYHGELASILNNSKLEYYVRSTVFSVLAYHDRSATFASEQALKLLRKDDLKTVASGSEAIYKELGKKMTAADRELLATRLAKLHAQPTNLFENASEIQAILKLAALSSEWPARSLNVLKDIQKNSPEQYARDLAGPAIKTVEGDS